MKKYICIHGHFYQPPRENPWLEEVELQESAHPYHDWNDRITDECYAPNAASRILDGEHRIVDVVNNYSKISFNFGPTLLSWMARHRPLAYEMILEADRMSLERFSGHGSAIAQVYNHMIMPLANERDKYTQAIWGIRDFETRFGRFPEGMWLPETAADTATLEVLADLGIRFTLLAPNQASRLRLPNGKSLIANGEEADENGWLDVSGSRIDPTRPYLCRLPSGRSIALFFYDGPISQELAFGETLHSGEAFSGRLFNAFNEGRDWEQMVHIATDGETYGHHHRRGDMALAYCLHEIEQADWVEPTVYGEYLEQHPPELEVEIFDNSSWSCVHGVERWKADCGCNSGMKPGWQQQWRKPLRDGLNYLRDTLVPLYEQNASRFLRDPWGARNAYIDVLTDRSPASLANFFQSQASRELGAEERTHVVRLLELQRNAMLMFTSCGWFFDEISGIETTQVMAYAARTIQLAQQALGVEVENGFLDQLRIAPSNIPEFDSGAEVYERFIKPMRLDLPRVGAHFAISSLFHENLEEISVFCYKAQIEDFERRDAGTLRLTTGRMGIVSDITLEERHLSFAAVSIGGHSINAGVLEDMDENDFAAMRERLHNTLVPGDIPGLLAILGEHFGKDIYSLWYLFKDEQHEVLNQILGESLEETQSIFRSIVDRNYTTMNYLAEMGMHIPQPLVAAAQTVLNRELLTMLERDEFDADRFGTLVADLERWSVPVDHASIGYAGGRLVTQLTSEAEDNPEDLQPLEHARDILNTLVPLGMEMNLWRAQNTVFAMSRNVLPHKERAPEGEGEDKAARHWAEVFRSLADLLRIRVENGMEGE